MAEHHVICLLEGWYWPSPSLPSHLVPSDHGGRWEHPRAPATDHRPRGSPPAAAHTRHVTTNRRRATSPRDRQRARACTATHPTTERRTTSSGGQCNGRSRAHDDAHNECRQPQGTSIADDDGAPPRDRGDAGGVGGTPRHREASARDRGWALPLRAPKWETDTPSSTVPQVRAPPLPAVHAYTLPAPRHHPPSCTPSRADDAPSRRHGTMPPPRQRTAADQPDAATSAHSRRARIPIPTPAQCAPIAQGVGPLHGDSVRRRGVALVPVARSATPHL
ncbi:hypothetical protein BJ912DRAFT_1069892 [Pholiota molesta]|nr:hypothetical protein BJ912DRAFT_1069892 [Pholiota molesta]